VNKEENVEGVEEQASGGDPIQGFRTEARMSAISPSLDALLKESNSVNGEAETKSAKRRRKQLAKLNGEKGLVEGSPISSSSMAEQQKTIEVLMEMNMKLQADINELMGKVQQNDNAPSAKANRRASIGMISQQNANDVIRSVVPVAESEKTKVLTCFSIMSLQRKMNELQNQGIPASLINYIGLNILERILMWLTMGYGQEAGLESHMFESTEDLKQPRSTLPLS
jgi:hypothetical protein